MKLIYQTLVASFLLFPCLSVFAQGKLVFVKGNVKLGKNQVKKGAIFKNGQTLVVSKGALAIAKFENGNTLKVNENSEVQLTKLAKKEKEKTLFRLLKGSSFFNKDKAAKGHLVIKAKNVAMGVRGTTFFVSYGQKKSEDVYMCVKEGRVIIKAPGDKKAVAVNAGEGVRVSNADKTSAPKPLPWTKNLNWKLSPKEKDLVNKATIEESYSDITTRDYD